MLRGMDRNRASADNWPTQQLWPTPGQGGNGGYGPNPPGSNGPGSNGPGSSGPPPGGEGPRRTGRMTRWVIGITAAAVLAGGGALALASTAAPAAPSGQAATLNTVLSSADSPSVADMAAASPTATSPSATPSTSVSPAAGVCAQAAKRLRAAHHPVAARRVRAGCRRGLARIRLLVRGIHGQFTYQTKKGTKTLAFERGTIQSVSGTTLTVAASDGTTWTWHLVGNTVVRQDGKKVASSTLADGQRAFVGGPVVSGADNARLVVLRPAKSASSAPAS